MSSILKALKKLEHDKTVRKPDSFRISEDILRSGSARGPASSAFVIAALIMFACGVGATYLYMKRGISDPGSSQQTHTLQREASERPVPPTPAPATVEQPIHTAEKPPSAPSPAEAGSPRETQGIIFRESNVRAHIQTKPEIAPVPAASPPPASAVSAPAPLQPAVSAVPHPARPVLRLDGIAFQDGVSNSVAVVNGTTVSRGSVIEGARVEEILKDRVRFIRDGEKLEVILDKSN